MIKLIGEWLGTERGFWATMALVLVSAPVAYLWHFNVSTWVLSVVAIMLPAFILRFDHERDKEHSRRERVMNMKLDQISGMLTQIQTGKGQPHRPPEIGKFDVSNKR